MATAQQARLNRPPPGPLDPLDAGPLARGWQDWQARTATARAAWEGASAADAVALSANVDRARRDTGQPLPWVAERILPPDEARRRRIVTEWTQGEDPSTAPPFPACLYAAIEDLRADIQRTAGAPRAAVVCLERAEGAFVGLLWALEAGQLYQAAAYAADCGAAVMGGPLALHTPAARRGHRAGEGTVQGKLRKRAPWVERLSELDAKHRNVSKANRALWREYHAACPKYGTKAKNLPQQWAGKCDRWRQAAKPPEAVP